MAERECFEMNYGETAQVLNTYASICKIYQDLDSPYFCWKKDNVEVAKRLIPLISDFLVKVPEGVTKDLTINPEQIKKRCLEIIADKPKE
jgi:hypothetical protein